MFTRTLAASSNEDAEHIPLMGDADDPRGDVQQRQRSDVSKLGYPRLLPLLVLSALATSLLSFMWNGNQLNNRFHRPSIDVPSLRHPSLYIGLDRVPEIKSVLASQQATANSDNHHETMPTLSVPIHGRPRRIVRVNSDYPGTVYPEDHWVLLSKKVSPVLLLNIDPCIKKRAPCPSGRDLHGVSAASGLNFLQNFQLPPTTSRSRR